jgi:hypothetical protein
VVAAHGDAVRCQSRRRKATVECGSGLENLQRLWRNRT